MKSTRRTSVALVVVAAVVASTVSGPVSGAAPPAEPGLYVYQVHAPLGHDITRNLTSQGFDVLEHREGDNLFVLGDAATGASLRSAGFEHVVDHVLPAPRQQAPAPRGTGVEETYYGGYHTVDAHWAHLDQTAEQHPDLATLVDYGDSWLKTQGAGGHDLRAICITRKNPGDCALTPDAPKPRFFVMGQLHAREITTGDVAWRWIDHLVQGYGADTEVTALLDSTEVWVVPIANPDGVEVVQSGGDSPVFHRKNVNNTNDDPDLPPCTGTSASHSGVDLNRNTSTHWGEYVSDGFLPCMQTYRGPHADSEVETLALQALWRNLYRDRRDTGAAPPDTTGIVLSLHSYGNLVLMPWSWSTETRTGNDAPMRQLTQDLATMAGTGWRYGQSGQVLYEAFGTTDDWAYDALGVASFVWEVGPSTTAACGGFFPTYSCQENTFWPKLEPMLRHTASKAANPYAPSTPSTTECPEQTNDTDTPIQPQGDFATSTITITDCEGNSLSAAKIEVHVKHNDPGDLILDLIAPDGTPYRLRDTIYNWEVDIDITYTVDLSFEPRTGPWQLKARDTGRSGGHIDSWTLMI